jgi:hypothetical protein
MTLSIRRQLSALVQRRFYAERRDAKRMAPRHRTLCVIGTPTEDRLTTAFVHDLSLRGVSVLAEREFAPGVVLKLLFVNAAHTFSATRDMKVARCFRAADNRYFVAGPFVQPLTHEEVVPLLV